MVHLHAIQPVPASFRLSMRNDPCQQPVTGLILAGGRGSRMAGRDKGLLTLAGRPLVEHARERLLAQTEQLLISANRNAERYGAYGHAVLADASGDYPGPLAGLLAGLRACDSDWLISVPCDAPLLGSDFRARLCAALRNSHGRASVAHDGNRIQPLHLLLHRDLAVDLERFLDSGQRKVQDWVASIEAVPVDFSDQPQQFWNVNTVDEQQRLEAYLQT